MWTMDLFSIHLSRFEKKKIRKQNKFIAFKLMQFHHCMKDFAGKHHLSQIYLFQQDHEMTNKKFKSKSFQER
jgi:hypothetical protein